MLQTELPADVRLLLQERIHSIEQLEILLLMRGDPGRRWSSLEVDRVVRSNERSVAETLEKLSRQGLLSRADGSTPTYTFAPRDDALRETVGRLAHLYQERRVRIVQAIYSERIPEVDEFAKAFKLRKDPHG